MQRTDPSASAGAPLRSRAQTFDERLLSTAFLLSGAAGLIFQVVWFHRCGLVFGNTTWATSIVLSSFMGGLTLGSLLVVRHARRIRSFLATYAALEVAVAVGGIGVTVLLPRLPWMLAPVTRELTELPWLLDLVRAAATLAVLMVPAMAMGATLPVLTGAMGERPSDFGRVLGRLYAWNTFGAVAGVVGAELLLVPRIGILGSAWVAASLNVIAAAVVLWVPRQIFHRPADGSGPSIESRTPTRGAWRLLVCAFLTGGALLILEIVWFRFLAMQVVTTTVAISMILAVVLAAIALGGVMASVWLDRNPDADDHLATTAFGMTCALILSYQTFPLIGAGRSVEWQRIAWLATWLTFPTALLSGTFLTLLGQTLRRELADHASAAGTLMLANTLGAMCGPLVAAYLLLPTFGMERSLFAVAVLYAAVALVALRYPRSRKRRASSRFSWTIGVAAVLLLARFPFGLMSGTFFARAANAYTGDGSRLIATIEGTADTIFLTQQTWMQEPIYYRLITNGFSMTGTAVPARRYMRQFVYLPMLVSEVPLRRILVICYGVGVTVGAATDIASVESIDVVEISKDIVAMSDRIYGSGDHPLHDKRVRLHLEDGRYFLQSTAGRFDLITGEPPPPLTPGTANIYSREYFQLIHDRLVDGGLATYWLPVARQEGVAHAAIIRAFCDVFSDCSLWNGTPNDLILLGSRGRTRPFESDRFLAAWNDSVLASHLREAGFEQPGQFGATFLGDAAYLTKLTEGSQPLVDNFPRRVFLAAPTDPRLSLLDDGGTAFLEEILNPLRAQKNFEDSTFISQLWPEPLRRQTLPFFAVQRIVNRVLAEGANVLGQIEDVHFLLTRTSLQTLPYWLLGLGNHPILRRVDAIPDDGSGQVQYVRGLRALVERDFQAAADHLSASNVRGMRGSRPLAAYALSLAGRLDSARQMAQGAEVSNADLRHFWNWLERTFGVGPNSTRKPN
jgi:predicted membrane-bound spermidine synthase